MKRLDRVTAVIGRKQYSLRTEKTYRDWIVAFLRFHRDGWDRRHTQVVAEATRGVLRVRSPLDGAGNPSRDAQ